MRASFLLIGATLLGCQDEQTLERPPPLDPLDHDRDGFSVQGSQDCDDQVPAVHPGATEACNARDDDCDGSSDEDYPCVAGAEEACPHALGWFRTCGVDCAWGGCAPPVGPTSCDSVGACVLGTVEACASDCGLGTRVCGPGCHFGPCERPQELCNGLDDDCDGQVDEGTLGLSGPLQQLPWGGRPFEILSAAGAGGFAVGAYRANVGSFQSVIATVVGPDGELLSGPFALELDASIVWDVDVVAAGDRIAVIWSASSASSHAVGVAFFTPLGLEDTTRLDWDVLSVRGVWVSGLLAVVGDSGLWVIDADANVIAQDLQLFGGGLGSGWGAIDSIDDQIVVPRDDSLGFFALDGQLVRRVDLVDDPQWSPTVAVIDDQILTCYLVDEDVHLVSFDREGVEQWHVSEHSPGFQPRKVVPFEQGLLVVPVYGLGGWVVSPEGETLDGPRWWAAFGGFWNAQGSVARADPLSPLLAFLEDTDLSVAQVGCALDD